MAEKRDAPTLPCPECRMRGAAGGAPIGNHRTTCGMCNRFAQSVRRVTYRKLLALFPDQCATLRLEAELELYKVVLAEFLRTHPAARATAQEDAHAPRT